MLTTDLFTSTTPNGLLWLLVERVKVHRALQLGDSSGTTYLLGIKAFLLEEKVAAWSDCFVDLWNNELPISRGRSPEKLSQFLITDSGLVQED